MKLKIWLLVAITALLTQNMFLQLQLVTLRKAVTRLMDAQTSTMHAVANVAGGVQNNAQSIHALANVSTDHARSIVQIEKAMYTIWRRKP